MTSKLGEVSPEVRTYFHNTFNSNNLANGRPHSESTSGGPYQPIYLADPANQHCIIVRRGQYKSGSTYFIKARLTDKPAATVQP